MVSIEYKTGGRLGTVELDATVSETHSAASDVTQHPVEAGANVVDHVRPKPRTLVLEAIVTDTPVPNAAAPQGEWRAQPGRAAAAWETLMRLREARQPLTVVSLLGVYENMVIQDLTVPRTTQTGGDIGAPAGSALHFTATLLQVRVVSSQYELLPVRDARAQKNQKGGKKVATPVSQERVLKSRAAQAIDGYKSDGFSGVVDGLSDTGNTSFF